MPVADPVYYEHITVTDPRDIMDYILTYGGETHCGDQPNKEDGGKRGQR